MVKEPGPERRPGSCGDGESDGHGAGEGSQEEQGGAQQAFGRLAQAEQYEGSRRSDYNDECSTQSFIPSVFA